jgi:quinol monooxygenase YgiN
LTTGQIQIKIKEENMATQDKCCTIVPYFKVPAENLQAFKKLCEAFVEKSSSEPKCLYYGFTFDGNEAHCREGYSDAEGMLTHLENVGALLQEALKIAEISRLEVHGPEGELAKLRGPLAALKPQFFTLEFGFRK